VLSNLKNQCQQTLGRRVMFTLSLQIVPKRVDWEGEQHDQNFDELVRIVALKLKLNYNIVNNLFVNNEFGKKNLRKKCFYRVRVK